MDGTLTVVLPEMILYIVVTGSIDMLVVAGLITFNLGAVLKAFPVGPKGGPTNP
jgi:hypothetical protein